MTTIPSNLTLFREDFRNPRSLRDIKADLLAAPTDYVMVVGKDDTVDVTGELSGQVHYLATHVGTRRAIRYFRPVLAHNPLLLTQFNYIGSPILHKSLVPLFPEAAVEPWHTVMVRAQAQGVTFALVSGEYGIVEPWPRHQPAGVHAHFRTPFDPAAVMEAMPNIVVEEINYRPYYSLRDQRVGATTVFVRNCGDEFVSGLARLQVRVENVPEFDLDRMRAAGSEYVAWFDGIHTAVNHDTLVQLQIALEFPGGGVASPRVISDFSVASLHMPAFWLTGGIYAGIDAAAWMSRTVDLGSTPPVSGCTTSHAILGKTP